MEKTYNGVTFTTCTAYFPSMGETEADRRPMLYIHDLADEFRDGDRITAAEMPRDEEEAASILEEHWSSDYLDLLTPHFASFCEGPERWDDYEERNARALAEEYGSTEASDLLTVRGLEA